MYERLVMIARGDRMNDLLNRETPQIEDRNDNPSAETGADQTEGIKSDE